MGSYINNKVETPYDYVIVLVLGILTFLNVWLSIIFQEGRTCDWEWFLGRYELMLQLGRTKEFWKSRDTLNRKLKIRKDYQVTLPLESFLSGLYSKTYGVSMERRQQKRQLLRITLFIGGGTEASTHGPSLTGSFWQIMRRRRRRRRWRGRG